MLAGNIYMRAAAMMHGTILDRAIKKGVFGERTLQWLTANC